MTDDNLTPPPAPSAPPAYSAAPGAGAKKGLSLTGFILGTAALVFFWTTWFAIILGIAALVLSFIGRAKEKGAPRWMWLLGIIFGIVAIVIAVVLLIVAVALVGMYNNGQLNN